MIRQRSRLRIVSGLLFALGLIATPLIATRPTAAQEMPLTVGSGKSKSENREVRGIHQIRVSGAGKLVVTEGDSESLTIEADDNLLPLLRSDVRGGVLYLGVKEPYRIETKKEIRYRLQVRRGSVERINLSGAIDGEVGSWNSDRMALGISGSARVKVGQLYARSLVTEISGAAKVKIEKGTVGQQRAEISGASIYDAEGLATRETHIQASGASKILVRAEERLRVAASGASVIEYAGKPEVQQQLSGACTVRRKD